MTSDFSARGTSPRPRKTNKRMRVLVLTAFIQTVMPGLCDRLTGVNKQTGHVGHTKKAYEDG